MSDVKFDRVQITLESNHPLSDEDAQSVKNFAQDGFRVIRVDLLQEGLDVEPEPAENKTSGETWWAYECFGKCIHDDSGGGVAMDTSGVVLDVRTDNSRVDSPPKVMCPICGDPMDYKDMWEADDNGYGSRGDGSGIAPMPRILYARRNCLQHFVCSDRPCQEYTETAYVAWKHRFARTNEGIDGWFHVEDKLPPPCVPVLAYLDEPRGYQVIEYDEQLGWGDELNGYCKDECGPTHWCAIPTPRFKEKVR